MMMMCHKNSSLQSKVQMLASSEVERTKLKFSRCHAVDYKPAEMTFGCFFSSADLQEFWSRLVLRQGDEIRLPVTLLRVQNFKYRLPWFPSSSVGRPLPGTDGEPMDEWEPDGLHLFFYTLSPKFHMISDVSWWRNKRFWGVYSLFLRECFDVFLFVFFVLFQPFHLMSMKED